jgi:hypothetical protein
MITSGKHNKACFSALHFIEGWINSCSMIKDQHTRKNVFHNPWLGRSIMIRIIDSIIHDKMNREKNFSKNSLSLIYSILVTFGFSKEIFFIFLILPLSVMPRFLFKLFLKFYIYLKYGIKGRTIPSELKHNFSEKKSVDPFRKL